MAGTDWKSALAALGTSGDIDKTEEKKEVDRNKRVGVVFSTNPDFGYSEEEEPENANMLPKNQQKLRLYMERAGRGGKTVTVIKGFIGTDMEINALCKFLKQKCGVGGSAKDGEIVIQGDHRPRLVELLKREGYTQTK